MNDDIKTIPIEVLVSIATRNYEKNPTPDTLKTKVALELQVNAKR
jgi:hypothetical protein